MKVKDLEKFGIAEISFTELKSKIKRIISRTKTKEELESVLENSALMLKQRRENKDETIMPNKRKSIWDEW